MGIFVTKFTEDEYDYDALNLINEHIEMSDSEYRVVDDYVTSESESEDGEAEKVVQASTSSDIIKKLVAFTLTVFFALLFSGYK
ncbi:hypothetical protein BpHYR1_041116 [Brachionus plicatilis]|uniref:Uncharacterized protein n=1 Tax=Brachionus plicatilis TaxID=10195 RepID=A0A3M7S474_BRAPC|nr:hypothetical protein BpHYR1_041116 [Brachionus plicatilis]